MPATARNADRLLLLSLPHELLENIALYCACTPFLGPPHRIISLLLTCRTLNSSLSYDTNSHLYAKIFKLKFDHAAPLRRLGPERVAHTGLGEELKARCIAMKRMRALGRSNAIHTDEFLTSDLWMAYLMCLESDGNNAEQLVKYALLGQFVKLYVSREMAPRSTIPSYPLENVENSLALWIAWFLCYDC